MWNFRLIFVSVILSVTWQSLQGARILAVYSICSRSHYIVAEALLKELATRGHNVTVVSKFPQSTPTPNFRDIHLKYSHPGYDALMTEFTINAGDSTYFVKSLPLLQKIQTEYTRAVFDLPEYKQLLNEEFDLLIVEGMFGDLYLGLAAHFKCPSVSISSLEPQQPFSVLVGNPSPISFVKSMFVDFPHPMALWQRVLNFFGHMVMSVTASFAENTFQDIYKQQFPPSKYPSLNEMRRNVSLALTNYHFTQGSPRPNVPAMVDVGGLQVKERVDPLPADLKAWIDGADHGVIYLSFGTNVKTKDLSLEKMNHIRDTFSQLKQRIIWKFENETIPDLPKNVKIWKWLPQDDLLAHPNIKLFITHGGLGSVLEAKVRGVPIVGIPVFGDQMANVAVAEKEGWATVLHYNDLVASKFTAAIRETLENPKYREQVQYLSKLFLDRPTSPMETAVFWVEYVLRHHGAKHMQAHSVHMGFIELYSIDVIAVLLTILLCVCLIIYFLTKFMFRMLFRSTKSKQKTN